MPSVRKSHPNINWKELKWVTESWANDILIKFPFHKELEYLPFEGPVQLKDPDSSYMLYEYYGVNPNNTPEQPLQIFFGRLVSSH